MKRFGGHTMAGTLRRVLVKHPRQAWGSAERVSAEWRRLGYFTAPDFDLALRQYDAFMALLEAVGAEPVFLPEAPGTGLDSIYIHDPLLVTDHGVVICRMGKDLRRSEPEAAAATLDRLGIPVLGRIEAPGLLEGGDVVWLDDRTVAVGIGYRSNAAGVDRLERLLDRLVDQVFRVPLPHWTGPAECMHLMSLLSPVDRDVLVVYSRLLPVPFRQLLLERGFRLVEVPDAEFDSMAPNVLAVAPRRCIMLAGNPVTRDRLHYVGAEVRMFDGSEICLKGGGGPTCLTRPLLRDPIPTKG